VHVYVWVSVCVVGECVGMGACVCMSECVCVGECVWVGGEYVGGLVRV